MEKLGIILAFYALFGCLWWVVAKIKANIFMTALFKLFGITGCLFSAFYIVKYFNII